MANIVLTKIAHSNRVLRGISLPELEDAIKHGIKIRQHANILAKHENILLVYTKKSNTYILKTVGVR